MRNLFTRTLTGIILVACILSTMIWHPVAISIVIYVLMIIGLKEFYRLTDFHGIQPEKTTGYIIGSLLYIILALIALEKISGWFLLSIPIFFSVFFITELFRDRQNAVLNVAFSIFSIIYITLPLATLTFFMNPRVTGDYPHWHLIFSYFIILWSHDTFAYLTGIALGKHKLFEKVSPKKTWEGSIGGLIFGMLAALVLSLFFIELTVWQWMLAAILISVSGTFGDLSESLIKRKFNVKDTGDVFPGHGGVLDRFDAVLFSAPVFLFYLLLLSI